MLTEQDRIWWQTQSLNYYLGGRILILDKQVDLGFTLLGYAIEVYLKQGLLEKNYKPGKRSILLSHHLPTLYEQCKGLELYKDVKIPRDFLEYANLLLNWRYPSQVKKSIGEAAKKDKTISKEFGIIHCYDEVICKLDKALFALTGDKYSSGIHRIIIGIDKAENRKGLYYNAPVLSELEHYKRMAHKFADRNVTALDLLDSNDEKFFWSPLGESVKVKYDLNLGTMKLKTFRLPGKIERDVQGKATIITFGSPFNPIK